MKKCEVKQCLNKHCRNKGKCVHGQLRQEVLDTYGKKWFDNDIVRKMFPSMNPVHISCKRYITDKID